MRSSTRKISSRCREWNVGIYRCEMRRDDAADIKPRAEQRMDMGLLVFRIILSVVSISTRISFVWHIKGVLL
jgi:hypothetical protein